MQLQQILESAIVAYKAGELEQAKNLFQIVAAASPLNPDPYTYLGNIGIQTNQPKAAVHYFLEALRLNPNNPLHHSNLAGALLIIKQLEEALAASDNALALDADYSRALLISGTALLALGRIEESRVRLQRLLFLHPDNIEGLYTLTYNVRFLLCFLPLNYIYNDEEEIAAVRSRYERELLALHDLCQQLTPAELSLAAYCVGSVQPFLLPYQGGNDRILQALYGDIVARLMTARYPAWEKQLPLRRRTRDERIRVGIVSSFFKSHSVWKTHIRGWIKQINHNAFAVFGYHTDCECDETTKEARTYLERLTSQPKTFEEYCAIIRDDNLDVLIFPEIGMNPITMRLAALRLAPVQCTSWGHPNTSGLQTIDFFLSSALMEPPDGDTYYTEKLIRLPNLSIYYEPLTFPYLKSIRADFGLRENAILYWCCQVPIKYHPRYDEVFVKIARDVPNAQLVFIESVPLVASQFRTRIERAFARFDLRASDYCVFLPRLNSREFEEAAQLMDVFLDSLGWSGCNSSLESLAHNLPLVTLPGLTMRSRHTAAILTMMGMEDCIATSQDDYIRRAVSLGRHPEERLRMRAHIAAHKQQVYRDETAIIALESFLSSVVG